jgi:hypothetical protein
VYWRSFVRYLRTSVLEEQSRSKGEGRLASYQWDLIELDAGAGANKRTANEKPTLVSARRGQGRFRDGLVELWGCCAVSDCRGLNLLRASHIRPWKIANDSQRLDKFNGLLLSPNLDAAFDAGLIRFAEDGKSIISKSLRIAGEAPLFSNRASTK